jgi:hypothetical protein
MVKYSPKENTYKEMYLINKFEKDIMENSLQNMRNDKRKTAEKSTMVNNISLETQNESLENTNKKTIQPVQESQNQVSNENSILNIPEEENTATEKELPLNIDLSDNENTTLSPSNLKRILATEKSALKKIRQIMQKEKKKNKNKGSKTPEKRTTRRTATDLNRKRITVKNVSKPLSMITSKTEKKRKSGNANETIDEIFQNWNV